MSYIKTGISFAAVQEKEHFYCTNQKTCVISIFTRLEIGSEKRPILSLPGCTTKGLRDKKTPIHSNLHNLPK